MRNSKAINALASLYVLGTTGVLLFSVNEFPPSFDPKPCQATGWMMAQEAHRYLKPGGELAVIKRDTAAFPHPQSDFQFKGFEQALREANAHLATVLPIQLDPLRPLVVPSGEFFALLRRARPGSVIVSFMGPPILTQEQHDQLEGSKAAVIAFCPGDIPKTVDLQALFSDGLLQSVVVRRKKVLAAAAPCKDSRECFDRSYQVVTASDTSALEGPSADNH